MHQACAAGERATTQIGKNGENKAAMFRFNPGKTEKIFPPKHPYFPKGCGKCEFTKLAYNPNSEKCRACKVLGNIRGKELEQATRKAINAKIKKRNEELMKDVPTHGTLNINGDEFLSGRMMLAHRSLIDVFEHCNPNNHDFRTWLIRFSEKSVKGWQYEGWAPNRPIQPGQKGYDPKKPNKKKHPETEYFTYYSLTIKGKTYWANVKMHKPFKGEVLYTIEENKPKDLIEGLPKTGKDQ